MNKTLLLFLSAAALASCAIGRPDSSSLVSSAEPASSASSESVSSVESKADSSASSPSEESSVSSEDSRSSEQSVSSEESIQSASSEKSSEQSAPSEESISSEEVGDPHTASGIRSLCLALEGQAENERGMVFGTTSVSFEARVFFYGNSICAKSGTGNPYFGFAMDETGYVYAAVPSNIYDGNASKYAGQDNQYFRIEGTVSLCYGIPQVQVTGWTFLESPSFSIGEAEIQAYAGELSSIEGVFSSLSSARINEKGCHFGSLTHLEMKYLAKMDDAVLLFTDGAKVIKVHGNSKISNSFSLGSSYDFYGVPDLYIYAPGIEYVYAKKIEKAIETPAAVSSVTAASTYSWKYTNDTTKHAAAYENAFGDLRIFEGYVNGYVKNSSSYLVLTDASYSSAFSTVESATQAKSLFVKNDTEVNLKYESDLKRSTLYPHFQTGAKIRLTFAPYLWNTQKYFQAFILTDTIEVID